MHCPRALTVGHFWSPGLGTWGLTSSPSTTTGPTPFGLNGFHGAKRRMPSTNVLNDPRVRRSRHSAAGDLSWQCWDISSCCRLRIYDFIRSNGVVTSECCLFFFFFLFLKYEGGHFELRNRMSLVWGFRIIYLSSYKRLEVVIFTWIIVFSYYIKIIKHMMFLCFDPLTIINIFIHLTKLCQKWPCYNRGNYIRRWYIYRYTLYVSA